MAEPAAILNPVSPELVKFSCGFTSLTVDPIPAGTDAIVYPIGRFSTDNQGQQLEVTQIDARLWSTQPTGSIDLWSTGETPADWGGGPLDPPLVRAWIIVDISRRFNPPEGQWSRWPVYLPGMCDDGQVDQGRYLFAQAFPPGNANSDATTRDLPYVKSFVPEVARVKWNEQIVVAVAVAPATASAWEALVGTNAQASGFANVQVQCRRTVNGVALTE